MNKADQLLTTGDVGKIMGLTPAAVRYLEATGILQGDRLAGGLRVFRRSDVEKAIERRAATGPRQGRPYKPARGVPTQK